MKKIQARKFAVRRESLRHLDGNNLKNVVGGVSQWTGSPCGTTHVTKDPEDGQ